VTKTRVFVLLLLALIGTACNRRQEAETVEKDYAGKRVLVVHSYHQEVPGVIVKDAEMKSLFTHVGIGHEFFYMDTRRNREEAFIKNSALRAKATIERYRPDVVITFDDNALKYLIMPYYRDSELPVVFAGIDWDATVYGLPYTNTTGMVSVALVPQMLDYLRQYANGDRIAWLGYDTLTAQKESAAYLEILHIDMSVHRVTTFDEWRERYLELQTETDMIIQSSTVMAMPDWDDTAAAGFALETARIPVGCVNDTAMVCSTLGLVKEVGEQAEWAAATAIEIIDGKKPSEIPLTNNKLGQIVLNLDIAEKLDIVFDPVLLKNARIHQTAE
jgi:hypothetical protein